MTSVQRYCTAELTRSRQVVYALIPFVYFFLLLLANESVLHVCFPNLCLSTKTLSSIDLFVFNAHTYPIISLT